MTADGPYYLAYEKRYRAVLEAGADRWGHDPSDPVLLKTLTDWVSENGLSGKRVLEFACGEGAAGVILSGLGCLYHGVDIAPTAVEQARKALRGFPNARVSLLDMARESVQGEYDAAFDSMGFHMLVTDGDRTSYLANACRSLKPGAPMLFFRQSYRSGEEVWRGRVKTFDDWKRISGSDYDTPAPREARAGERTVVIRVPLIPARANDREGYTAELGRAGFTVERFEKAEKSGEIWYAAHIYARKRTG